MQPFTTQIASVPDREFLACEIWVEDEQLAELSPQPGGQVTIQIYPPRFRANWTFVLADFQVVLEEAIHKLGVG